MNKTILAWKCSDEKTPLLRAGSGAVGLSRFHVLLVAEDDARHSRRLLFTSTRRRQSMQPILTKTKEYQSILSIVLKRSFFKFIELQLILTLLFNNNEL
jgi:hypothetical protein